jgi:hypothetical protein
VCSRYEEAAEAYMKSLAIFEMVEDVSGCVEEGAA